MAPDPVNTGVGKRMILDLFTAVAAPDDRDNGQGNARRLFKGAPPKVLSIAGIDPSGGAGLLADIKTFTALGAYGCGVVAGLTAQSTQGVTAVQLPSAEFVGTQIDDFTIHFLFFPDNSH